MKNLSLIVLSVLFLAACQNSTDDLASPGKSQIAPRSQQARAFQATLSGALNLESAPTVCSGDLPLPILDYFISGNATHLGNLDASSFLHHDDCSIDLEAMTLTANVSGHLVGANGDWIEYEGEDVVDILNFVVPPGPDPSGPITGTWTITGGTGRFEEASGSFTISGIVDFTTLSFNVVAVGTITY